MFEAVHATPDGESTVARFATSARQYGYDGVVVRNHSDATATYDAEEIRTAYDVDVVKGVEVRAPDPQRASGHLGTARREHDIVLLHGGTNELNRFAVEQDRIDVLAHPNRGDGEFNHVLAKAAVENGVRVELTLDPILRASGGQRVQALTELDALATLVEKYDVPYVVSVDAFSHLHLRTPRELRALGDAIGLSDDWVTNGLREWQRLAERNRERRSDSFIEPGVERGRYETTDR